MGQQLIPSDWWVLQPLVEGEVPELGPVSSHLLGISANRAFKNLVSFLEISSISSLPAPSLPFPCLAPLSLCFSNLGIREGTQLLPKEPVVLAWLPAQRREKHGVTANKQELHALRAFSCKTRLLQMRTASVALVP